MKNLKADKAWAAAIGEQRVDKSKKLIAPMHLEALVVGKADKNALLKWKSVSPDYQALNDEDNAPLGEYMAQAPCKNMATPLHDTGIHLHWVLPQAYRHGRQEENDESPQFPYAPNRWLITRIIESNNLPIIKRWIIESDYVHTDADEPNWLMVNQTDPSKPLSAGDAFKTAMIGKLFDYDDWLNTGNKNTANDLFLTVISPCDPAFAASYHSCKNVFGFHDQFPPAAPDALYTYSVTGWISNPAHDLLANITDAQAWVDKMSSLSWSVADVEKLETLPGGVLCHAVINNVVWKKNAFTQSGKPTNTVKIGVGNTVSDALATIILQHKESGFDVAANPFLAALQYNVMANHANNNGREILKKLDALNGPGANTRLLKKQAHNRGFQSVSGGKIWVIHKKRNERSGFLSSDDKPEHNEPLQPTASNLLKKLNQLQYEHDTAINTLHTLQAERYANWYKETKLHARASGKKLLKAELTAHKNLLGELRQDNDRIEQLLSSLAGNDINENKSVILNRYYNSEIDKTKSLLTEALHADKNYDDYEITGSAMPPYYIANEPALVLTGLQPSSIYNGKQNIVCRTDEQLINTIMYHQDKADLSVVKVRYMDIVSDLGLSTAYLPAQIPLLLAETLALSPLLAKLSAELAWDGKGSPQELNLLSQNFTDIINHPAANADKFKNNDQPAVLPEEYAVKFRKQQPWIPLFMEWEIEWQPAYTKLQNGEVLEKWNFGEGEGKLKLNNIDYIVKPGAMPPAATSTYSGRVALSADLGDKLKEMKAILGKDHIVADIEPMYQSLSTLNQQLLSLESTIQLPPVKRSGAAYPVDAVINQVEEHYLWNPSDKNTGFYPLRSGMFQIKNLHIVDAFGQSMPVISAQAKADIQHSLHVSANMEKVSATHIALPPRLNSPARLRFKWLSAQEPLRETDTDPGTSPICGWLVQNKLDKSLMVFDATGNACCSLKLNSKNILIWAPPPGKDMVGLDTAISNVTLLDFVKSILDAGNETFAELLNQVSQMTQKAIKSGRSIANTGNLPLGTPLAVASASCQLELKDPPARDWNLSAAERPSLSNIDFPFYIGNNLSKKDGVIAYYTDKPTDDRVKKLGLPFAQYVSKKGVNMVANQPVKLSVSGGLFKAAPAAKLLLLLHPLMDVTISSGILPDATFKLPEFNMAKVLDQINFNFMINPVLVPGKQINVPVADVAGKKWIWMEKIISPVAATQTTTWTKSILDNKKSGKLNYAPVTAREGWLQIEKKD